MKKSILFIIPLMLFCSVSSHAQSLKDLLYKGKLKNDSNTVVRKTDDLSTKIDSGIKKPVETVKQPETVTHDSALAVTAMPDSVPANEIKDSVALPAQNAVNTSTNIIADNNKAWKAYMDSMVSTFNTEVLPSKKVKKETYYVFVDYEIGVDGQVNVNNIIVTPDNSFLQDEIKQRIILTAPQLTPVLSSTGKPMKTKRRYNFTLTKT